MTHDPKEALKKGKNLNVCFCDPASFIKNEITTIEYLKHQSAGLPNLYEICTACSNNLVNDPKQGMSFYLSWTIPDENYNYDILTMHVGVTINLVNSVVSDASYFFFVTANDMVIKKIHFDYTCPCNNRNSPQPLFHVQFPGELPSCLENELCIDHLFPKVSEPRVIYFPMTLALLLHIVFSEFPSIDTDKIKDESYWLSKHIKRDEVNVLRPFIKTQLTIIDNGKSLLESIYVS